MAEASEPEVPTLPPKGRVQAVRQQWSVHEDGALAYNEQQHEFNEHYGMNRFHRRTVREDIPIAKIVQSEEELVQQRERMTQLQALHAQAEEDERLARLVSDKLKTEVADTDVMREMDDEEIARHLQEKEKKKYERHLEKKREKMLKQERRNLEQALARESEEVGLATNSDNGSARIGGSFESLDTQGVNARRVTTTGRIEDGGDFSDFYKLPDEMDELSRMEIQATQDEELARLLQEQEHKRTKAEVDQDKLRQIELQDEQLARVMQEQEKLRLKKAKQKHKEKREAQKAKQIEQLPLGASANSMNQPLPHQQSQVLQQHSPYTTRGPAHIPAAPTPPSNNYHNSGAHSPDSTNSSDVAPNPDHTRYRRNSYTQAFDSPPSPPRSQPPPRRPVPGKTQAQSKAVPTSSVEYQNRQRHQNPPVSQSVPRSAYVGPGGGGMSTLESARRIAAGDPDRIRELDTSGQPSSHPRLRGSTSLQERSATSGTSTMDIIRAHSHHGNVQNQARQQQNSQAYTTDAITYSEPYIHQQQFTRIDPHDPEDTEVMKWMGSDNGVGDPRRGPPPQYPHHLKQQRQKQQAQNMYYSSEEEDDPHSTSNGGGGFNIAAAIDPTYQRRHPDLAASAEQTTCPVIPFSRSLPQADGELEWDPGLRGSLRKTKAPLHHSHQDSMTSGGSSHHHHSGSGMDPVMSSFQPVQGQRRGDNTKSTKSRGNSGDPNKKDKGNCKQQ